MIEPVICESSGICGIYCFHKIKHEKLGNCATGCFDGEGIKNSRCMSEEEYDPACKRIPTIQL